MEEAVEERQSALRRVQTEIVERKDASQRLRHRIEEDKQARQREAVQAAHEARATLDRTMELRREEHERSVQERHEQAARDQVCLVMRESARDHYRPLGLHPSHRIFY